MHYYILIFKYDFKSTTKNVTEIDFDSILNYIKRTKEMINFSFERLISINI